MENTKTNYQYLNDDGNWYPIEIKKCNMMRARDTINQGRPYQPVYIKDGKEHTIRYRRVTIESAIAELQCVVQHGDGTCNGKRYRLAVDGEDVSKPPLFLRMFVYGTLKCGYWNHAYFCGRTVFIEEATVRGRLYELPSGIPVLEIPGSDVLATGTMNPAADAALLDKPCAFERTCDFDGGDLWQDVVGELVTLDDPAVRLPAIDRLEGFRPGDECLYRRVLTYVTISEGRLTTAWCYVLGTNPITLRPTGKTVWTG